MQPEDWQVADPDLDEVRSIVACMPKSGSTYLTALVASLPGMRQARLVPGHERREQEICLRTLAAVSENSLRRLRRWERLQLGRRAKPRGWVAQMHVRYSEPTRMTLDHNRIRPVVLVRDVFDAIVSLADFMIDSSPFMAMAYVSEEMRSWPQERMQAFVADMAIPWYFNFYVGWQKRDDKLLLTYSEVTGDPADALARVAEHIGLPVDEADIAQAIELAGQQDTRLNKGVSGRGQGLSEEIKALVRRRAGYYPGVDFSPIGL